MSVSTHKMLYMYLKEVVIRVQIHNSPIVSCTQFEIQTQKLDISDSKVVIR